MCGAKRHSPKTRRNTQNISQKSNVDAYFKFIFCLKQTTDETAWTSKANFLHLFNPMMPLPDRDSANMASNSGPFFAWRPVAGMLLRRFMPFSHAVTWGWIAEQRSPLVPLVFSRTWGNPHYWQVSPTSKAPSNLHPCSSIVQDNFPSWEVSPTLNWQDSSPAPEASPILSMSFNDYLTPFLIEKVAL